MVLDLVPLWTILLGLAVFYDVVFDGFDLGVGMLYGLAPRDPLAVWCRRPSFRRLSFACVGQCDGLPKASHKKSRGYG